MPETSADALILNHESRGHYTTVDGIRTFALDIGSGPVVFCIHGVPTSSFLYRKVAERLSQSGLRALAIDLPGLGLSDRPEEFDYSFGNFGAFCNRFLDALGIEEVHLLIHDVGAPIGLSMAAEKGSRVKSITVLNSMLDVAHFEKPLAMRAFEKPLLGEAELALMTPLTFPLFMKAAGVVDMDVISGEEMTAYMHLLKREDGGKAFLKIMRHFDRSPEFTTRCYRAFQDPSRAVQLIWGDEDPFLPFDEQGREFELARRNVPVTKVRSKHFLQEEQWAVIAEKVKGLVAALQ